VAAPLVDAATSLVRGVVMTRRGSSAGVRLPALIVIGADGRRSMLARRVGIHQVSHRRRRATAVYATGIGDLAGFGELHIGANASCGVTPLDGGQARVWVTHGDPAPDDASRFVRHVLSTLPALSRRIGRMRFEGAPRSTGAWDAYDPVPGTAGLLLAGDAAGVSDPIAGTGIVLALGGGALAGAEALRALESGDFVGAVARLMASRRLQLGPVLRAARRARWCARHLSAVHVAGVAARFSPSIVAGLLRHRC
jgi:flavin-dependent dehydrogenase